MSTRTTITIDGAEHELDDNFLAHILETAVEGACSYWADVSAEPLGASGRKNRTRDFDVSDYTEGDDEEEEDDEETGYTRASFIVSNDPTEGGTLDLPGVADAIDRIASGDADVAPAVREIILSAVHSGDASDIDAEAADCIVQIALFDEVVYR